MSLYDTEISLFLHFVGICTSMTEQQFYATRLIRVTRQKADFPLINMLKPVMDKFIYFFFF